MCFGLDGKLYPLAILGVLSMPDTKRMAPRCLLWVNLNRKFSVSFRLCGETLCSDPTTETQRNRGHILCLDSPT